MPARRQSFSPWVRYPSLLLMHGIGVPAMKLLDKTGLFLLLAEKGRAPYGFFDDYQPTAHDVLACVYFKSGTNWLLQILLQITHRGRAQFEHVHDLIPWPDAHDPKYAVPLSDITAQEKSPTGFRIIKTHRKQSEVPWSPDASHGIAGTQSAAEFSAQSAAQATAPRAARPADGPLPVPEP